MDGVGFLFFFVRLVGGGWGGWVGFVLVCLVGFACLCKQITWLVAYLYPTQKHQPFGNCFLVSHMGKNWLQS